MDTVNQAFSEANTLLNEGQSVYDRQMQASKDATVAGDQLTQQANASNQKATEETQKAAAEATIMETTGSSGNLFQQNLTTQNALYGYNPENLQRTIQLQNQSEGLAKTALNQIQEIQGGTRGLSAAGVEAKVNEITTQSNAFQSQLGNAIAVQEGVAKTAEEAASKEANAQYNQEQLSEKAYTNAAAQYTSEANSYQKAAATEYNMASTYAEEAVSNVKAFMTAALSAMTVGLTAAKAELDVALTNMNNQLAASETSQARMNQQQTALTRQQIAFNEQQNKERIEAQKQANENYNMFIKAGVSNKLAQSVTGV